MFSIFKKKTDKPAEKPRDVRPRYVYKPNENAMAFRLEYREGGVLVYPGWSKALLFKIEGDRIYCAADDKLQYIIIGNDIYDAAGEKLLFRTIASEIYRAGDNKAAYELRSSITVQGTL